MKHLSSYLTMAIVALLATLNLTSCLSSDDDDNYISPEQYKQYAQTLSGIYHGKTYFYNDTLTTSSKTDSLQNVTMRIYSGDSTLVLYDFPASLIAKTLKNSTELKNNTALVEALNDAEPQDLKMNYLIVQSPSSNYILFCIAPQTLTYNLTYGGASHKVQAVFYGWTQAEYISSTKATTYLQFAVAAIYVDGVATQLYTSGASDTEKNNLIFEYVGTK